MVQGINNVSKIYAGRDYAYAIKDDRTVYGWGANEDGSFTLTADNTTSSQPYPSAPNIVSNPTLVKDGEGEPIRAEGIKFIPDVESALDHSQLLHFPSLPVFKVGENEYLTGTNKDEPTQYDGFHSIEADFTDYIQYEKSTKNTGEIILADGDNVNNRISAKGFSGINLPLAIDSQQDLGLSQWYTTHENYFNGLYYAIRILDENPLANSKNHEQIDVVSKTIADAAYEAFHAHDDITSEKYYKMLFETPEVARSFKNDAKINIAYVYEGRAKWYYSKGSLYNAIHFLGQATRYGNNNPDVLELMDNASRELMNEFKNNGNRNLVELLLWTPGVPKDIADEASSILGF